MSLAQHPYSSFLHRVEKPARYVGGEYNQTEKDPAEAHVRMALAFPDVYDIGMSHLGTKILYSLLNKHPQLMAERVFCPWVDMEAELRERKLPLLSLETASPLTEFDVVGFSLQYELTFTNVLTMLNLAGIPFRWEDRDESHPLIVAGGPNATQPEPVAPFFDVFLIGDAEEKLPEMLLEVGRCRDEGVSRRETLIRLAALGGLYCPALYETELEPRTGLHIVGKPVDARVPEKVERVVLEDLNRFPFPDDSPVAAAEAIFDRMSVEIARGCTEGCRFCQAGMIYRPVRERDPEEIVDTLVSAIEKGGYDEASMTTLSTADYSCISPLIKKVMAKLKPEKVSLSVASLRAYGLDEDLLDEIKSVRATGLTFAPEAGTQRMRDVVNKNITDEDLDRTAHRVFSRGWRRMKVYFMIGLPTERDEDVAGIMETALRMKQIGRQYQKGKVGVTVSVSSHVPKPWTPFQWAAIDTIDVIERKQQMLHDLSRRYRLEFRRHDPRTTYLECVLGRGDRRMADVVEAVWHKGARFDSWDEHLNWQAWLDALAEHDIPYDVLTGTLPMDVPLPWEHLDMKLERKFLERDYKRSLKDKLSPPCGKPVGAQVHHTNLEDHEADQRILVCYHCGVACDMDGMRTERADFLKKLGAYTPPSEAREVIAEEAVVATEAETITETVAKPNSSESGSGSGSEVTSSTHGEAAAEAQPEARAPKPRRKSKRNLPPTIDQPDAVRYRLRFSKSGVAALTGHLDFVRTLPRVVRRAGVPMFYSQGFHPMPAMEFSPPLPLGVVGLEEYVDLQLTVDIPPADLLTKLRAVAPSGLLFLDAARVLPGERKLSRAITAAEYVVRVDPANLALAADPDAVPDALLARNSVEWPVSRKRKPKTVDLRPAIQELRWADATDAQPVAHFDGGLPAEVHPGPGGSRFLFVRVDLTHESHARPEEVAAAMLGPDAVFEPIHVTRTRLVLRDAVTV